MPATPSAEGFLQTYLQPLLGDWLYVDSPLWTAVGFLGGGLFSARFLIQWLSTEKNRQLTVPPSFWYCSFWGSIINLIYMLHVDKAPLILANCFLPFLYLRNLIYLKRATQRTLKG